MTRQSHVKVAVFPVAGLGTRFLPATKAIPKEMLPLVDRPLIDYAVDEARAAGIEEFIFVTADGKEALEHHLTPKPALEAQLAAKGKDSQLAAVRRASIAKGHAHFIRQDDPRGLGHAVSLARDLVAGRPFAVFLPDDVIRAPRGAISQMIEAHARTGGHMVATMEVAPAAVHAYGVLDVTHEDGRLAHACGMVEKPSPEDAPSRLAVVGRYVLDASVFNRLAETRPGAGGEIQLTDAINADAGRLPLSGFRFEGERFDCGSPAGFLEATMAFAMERPDLRGAVTGRRAARSAA